LFFLLLAYTLQYIGSASKRCRMPRAKPLACHPTGIHQPYPSFPARRAPPPPYRRGDRRAGSRTADAAASRSRRQVLWGGNGTQKEKQRVKHQHTEQRTSGASACSAIRSAVQPESTTRHVPRASERRAHRAHQHHSKHHSSSLRRVRTLHRRTRSFGKSLTFGSRHQRPSLFDHPHPRQVPRGQLLSVVHLLLQLD